MYIAHGLELKCVFVCVCVCRFVLVPGDQCDASSDESQALLEKTSHDCTGHEQDSGFRPRRVCICLSSSS